MRAAGRHGLRLPKLGVLRTREHTGKLAAMLSSGRFHVYAASFRFERGHWVVAITGVAAQLHHQRRGPKNRYPTRVGGPVKPWRSPLTRTEVCCTRGRG